MSAFEDALTSIKQYKSKLTNQAKGLTKNSIIGSAMEQALSIVKKNAAKLGKKNPSKQQRASSGAYPVASMMNGQEVMSDGTVRNTDINNKLEMLRNSTLAQTSFTPEVETYLRSIPLGPNVQAGAAAQWDPYHKQIDVSRDTLNMQGQPFPVEAMTHEMMHALDANINADWSKPVSYAAQQGNTNDSYQFYGKMLSRVPSQVAKEIKDFLGGDLYRRNNPEDQADVNDTEGYAYLGGKLGDKATLSPMGDYYGKSFKQASKPKLKNASYLYPGKDAYKDLIRAVANSNVPGTSVRGLTSNLSDYDE